MEDNLSGRRLVENEAVFRKYNERVQRGLKDLETIASEHDQEELIENLDIPLHFHCECSDETCRERVSLKPEEYDRIHRDRKNFVILCGHEVEEIEDIIREEEEYCVVRKKIKPPEKPLKKQNA